MGAGCSHHSEIVIHGNTVTATKSGVNGADDDPYLLMQEDDVKKIHNAAGPRKDSLMTEKSWFDMLYAKYIPFMVRERFKFNSAKLQAPELEKFEGAVAFIDISGFTKLSEQLVNEHGTSGAELLNKYISGYFKRLIDVIVDFGGDILKFAGDAMLVLWRNKRTSMVMSKSSVDNDDTRRLYRKSRKDNKVSKDLSAILGGGNETLAALLLRAVACNMTLLKRLNHFEAAPGNILTLHTGVAAGDLFGIFVGGVEGLWEFFVAGDPIQHMSDACEQARAGEVVVHRSSYDLIRSVCSGKKLSSGNVNVTLITDPPRLFKVKPPFISSDLEEALEGFIPQIVKKRVDSGQSSLWLSEFRKVFVMFVALPDIDYHKPDVLETLQKAVQCVQESVQKYEGTVARLLADDKGTRFKIAFGMPTMAHEDDGVRVVLSALEIERELRKSDLRAAIGIATGTVYCGEAGSSTRCEYTAVGFKVIMAARLMQHAEHADGGCIILTDEDTHKAAQSVISFEPRPSIKLKGVAHPVQIFRPLAVLKNATKSTKMLGLEESKRSGVAGALRRSSVEERSDAAFAMSVTSKRRGSITGKVGTGHTIVGRDQERAVIQHLLQQVAATGETHIVLLEAEGGLGKSAFIYDFLNIVENMKIDFFYGAGDLMEKRTPYFGWRTMFEQLTGVEGVHNATKRKKILTHFLSAELLPWAVLLNAVLNTNFEESEFTRQMTTESRAKNLQKLLVAIMGATAKRDTVTGAIIPRVIVLEDLHWIDSGSWELAVDVCKLLPSLLVILTTRPLNRIVHLSKIMRMNTHKMTLSELTKSESLQLACNKFGVDTLPASLEQLIDERAQGHPLYIEELCRSLVEEGSVKIQDKQCIVADSLTKHASHGPSPSDPSVAGFAENLHTMIVGRIDRLPSDQQITLKVCAVIGLEVRVKLLRQIHPTTQNKKLLRKDLLALCSNGILVQEMAEKDLFSFKHGYFQEAAYTMLSLEQRKELHELIAQYYETSYKGADIEVHYSVLAHHYEKAEKWSKAISYKQLAGINAIAVNANHEAVKMFESVQEIMHKLGSDVNTAQNKLDVEMNLGNAYYAMGRYPKASVAIENALEMLGHPVPSNPRKQGSQLFKVAAKELFGRKKAMPKPVVKAQALNMTRETVLKRTILLLERLVRASMVSGLSWKAGVCAFKMADLAEELGDPATLALAMSQCAAACLELKWIKLAENYAQRTRFVMQSSDDTIGPLERARISFQDSFMYCYSGQWEYAITLLTHAKSTFARLSENKKWREAAFMEGIVLHFMGRYGESLTTLEELIESASNDGDLYFESSGLYWRSVSMMTTSGPSSAIRETLHQTLTIAEDLTLNPGHTLSFIVLHALNEYHLEHNIKHVITMAEKQIKYLGVPPNLIQQCPVHVNFVSLLLDACEHPDITPADHKHLLRLASRALEKLWSFCRAFPYSIGYAMLMQGRYEFAAGNTNAAAKQWKQAVIQANKHGMHKVVAYAYYELGRNKTSASDEENTGFLFRSRQLFRKLRIDVSKHPHLRPLVSFDTGSSPRPEGMSDDDDDDSDMVDPIVMSDNGALRRFDSASGDGLSFMMPEPVSPTPTTMTIMKQTPEQRPEKSNITTPTLSSTTLLTSASASEPPAINDAASHMNAFIQSTTLQSTPTSASQASHSASILASTSAQPFLPMSTPVHHFPTADGTSSTPSSPANTPIAPVTSNGTHTPTSPPRPLDIQFKRRTLSIHGNHSQHSSPRNGVVAGRRNTGSPHATLNFAEAVLRFHLNGQEHHPNKDTTTTTTTNGIRPSVSVSTSSPSVCPTPSPLATPQTQASPMHLFAEGGFSSLSTASATVDTDDDDLPHTPTSSRSRARVRSRKPLTHEQLHHARYQIRTSPIKEGMTPNTLTPTSRTNGSISTAAAPPSPLVIPASSSTVPSSSPLRSADLPPHPHPRRLSTQSSSADSVSSNISTVTLHRRRSDASDSFPIIHEASNSPDLIQPTIPSPYRHPTHSSHSIPSPALLSQPSESPKSTSSSYHTGTLPTFHLSDSDAPPLPDSKTIIPPLHTPTSDALDELEKYTFTPATIHLPETKYESARDLE